MNSAQIAPECKYPGKSEDFRDATNLAVCKQFGRCGGCSAQHIPYEAQLENKRKFVEGLIKKSGIEAPKEIKIFSGNPYSYRNRMDFLFFSQGLGLRKKGRWDEIIDIEKCPISNDRLNSLLNEVREWLFANKDRIKVFDIFKKTGTLRYAVIRTPDFSGDSSISFVINSDDNDPKTIECIKQFSQDCSAKNVILAFVPKDTDVSISEEYAVIKGNDYLKENLCGMTFYYDIQGFFQNNSAMAERMLDYCRGLFESYGMDKKKSLLLDLYGGVGTFGIICSGMFDELLTIESYKKSTEKAEKNIQENKIKNVKAICQDLTSMKKLEIEKLAKDKGIYALTDPPRSGMHKKTIQYLLDLKPKSIVYVSCNPEQLSKELIAFKDAYKINSIALFDLFPQTPHIECVVELVKR